MHWVFLYIGWLVKNNLLQKWIYFFSSIESIATLGTSCTRKVHAGMIFKALPTPPDWSLVTGGEQEHDSVAGIGTPFSNAVHLSDTDTQQKRRRWKCRECLFFAFFPGAKLQQYSNGLKDYESVGLLTISCVRALMFTRSIGARSSRAMFALICGFKFFTCKYSSLHLNCTQDLSSKP